MLDQSPLSKLIANNIDIPSREGARIQFESLQASDQQLSDIVRKKDIILPPDAVHCIFSFGLNWNGKRANKFKIETRLFDWLHLKTQF